MNHCIVDFWLHLKDQENNELQAQWGTAHMPRKQNRMVLGSIQASHLSYFLSAFLKPEKFTCEKLLKHRPLHCTDLHCNTLEALRLTIHLHPADYTLRGELEVANVGSKLLIPVPKPWEKEGGNSGKAGLTGPPLGAAFGTDPRPDCCFEHPTGMPWGRWVSWAVPRGESLAVLKQCLQLLLRCCLPWSYWLHKAKRCQDPKRSKATDMERKYF